MSGSCADFAPIGCFEKSANPKRAPSRTLTPMRSEAWIASSMTGLAIAPGVDAITKTRANPSARGLRTDRFASKPERWNREINEKPREALTAAPISVTLLVRKIRSRRRIRTDLAAVLERFLFTEPDSTEFEIYMVGKLRVTTTKLGNVGRINRPTHERSVIAIAGRVNRRLAIKLPQSLGAHDEIQVV